MSQWEGLCGCRIRGIRRVWTVYYGQRQKGKAAIAITKAQCDAMLARELISYPRAAAPVFLAVERCRPLPVLVITALQQLATMSASGGSGLTGGRWLEWRDRRGCRGQLTWGGIEAGIGFARAG